MKFRLSILLIFGLTFTLLSGCVATRPATDLSPLRSELAQLRQKQQQQAFQIEQNRTNLLSLTNKLTEQQTLIDDLRRESATKKVTPSREITLSPRPVTPPTASTETAHPQSSSPTEIYLQAFSDYAAGRFAQAIQGFETFLRLNAGSDYAGNAQYWLGECYYSQQQYVKAIEEFQRTVERYPNGSKSPDALLKMATAFNQLGQAERAEEVLRILRSRYPDSPAARRTTAN